MKRGIVANLVNKPISNNTPQTISKIPVKAAQN